MKTKLIGHAGQLADLFALTLPKKDRVKLLFAGVPGVGKTTLAERVAFDLCGDRFGVESVNGRHVTIHVVREWQASFASSSLFGTGWKTLIVNEVDLCQKDAQDALLSMLDEMPARRAFIGTSNLEMGSLTERFRTRFQRHEVKAPEAAEIAELLVEDMGLPRAVADQLATLSGGNVRAAILDAEAWANEDQVKHERRPKVNQLSLAAMGL